LYSLLQCSSHWQLFVKRPELMLLGTAAGVAAFLANSILKKNIMLTKNILIRLRIETKFPQGTV
jgi:hypothetical protein